MISEMLKHYVAGEQLQYRLPQGMSWSQPAWQDFNNSWTCQHAACDLLNPKGEISWRVKPKKRQGWLVIARDSRFTNIYPVKQALDNTYTDYIAQIEIEYEEGEGMT